MRDRMITAAVTAVGIAVFAGAAPADTIPERLMRDIGRDFDLADFQAAGVVGNLARETGNFRYLQELNPMVEGSRGGIGYSQWTASRRIAFEEYAGSIDNQLTYEANYGYLKQELSGDYSHVIDDVRGAENLWEATVLFMRGYLKPHPDEDNIRVSMNYANTYLAGDFSGSGCQASHEVTIDGRMIVVSTCPSYAGSIEGESFDVVLESSLRPRPRPAHIEAPATLLAEAGQVRPRPRPDRPEADAGTAAGEAFDPDETGRPDEEMRRAIADAIVLAMGEDPPGGRAATPEAPKTARDQQVPDGDEPPTDPNAIWKMLVTRKDEDEIRVVIDDPGDNPALA